MMIFTPGQLMVLVIFTEIIIYAALVALTNTIRHCATAKAYQKAMEKGMVAYYDDSWFANFKQNKEVKKDENN